jgi:hypothetical protein
MCRYQEALVSLATEVLHKLQFRFNQSQLEELDDDVLDDDVSNKTVVICIEFMLLIVTDYSVISS